MNKKQIIILGVILGVLLIGILTKTWVRSADPTVAKEVYSSLSFGFDPAKLEKVLIGRGSKAAPVELVRKNGRGEIENLWNAAADQGKVDSLFEAVRNARGELRSTDSSVLSDFGIGDPDAISLKLTGADNAALLDLKIGTKKAGQDGFFVRKSGTPEVYFVDVPFDRLFGIFTSIAEAELSADFWADLKLFTLDPEKVKKIVIVRLKDGAAGKVAGVERLAQKDAPPEGGWKLVGPQKAMPVDPDKVLRFIVTLNSVRAKGVADPAGKSYGLEKPVWRLSVIEGAPPEKKDPLRQGSSEASEARPSSQGGKTIILEAGPKDKQENVYFIKLRDVPQVFRLEGSFFEDLDISDDQFLKELPRVVPEVPRQASKPNADVPLADAQKKTT